MTSRPAAPVSLDDPGVRAEMKRWIDQWRRVGPTLEAERTAALQAMTEDEAARIAVEIVWPMGTLGDHRGGDDGAGLERIIGLQQQSSAR